MGVVITEIARVPEPEPALRHQSNRMSLVRYLVKEGGHVEAGEPFVLLENYWARFELVAEVPALVAKNLFDWVPGISLEIGSELALLAFDETMLSKGKPLISVRVATVLRNKGDPSNVR